MTSAPAHPAVSDLPRRMRDLSRAQWRILAETLVMLAFAAAAVRVLPFRRVVALASPRRSTPAVSRTPTGSVDELCWAVEAVAWRVPWRTVCFQKGLALHLMLRRRGIASFLHYGVGKDDDGRLGAHVWISVDDRIVQGGKVVDRFSCLASYPTID